MSPWIRYSLLRVTLFGGSFALVMALGVDWWWAAAIGSIIAITVSYIFFSRLRGSVAADLYRRRTSPDVDPDADSEDAAAEAARGTAQAPDDQESP